jgi:HlyD family secretion protein
MSKLKQIRPLWWILGSLALLLICGGVVAAGAFAARQRAGATLETAEVTSITAISSVESSGTIAAQQSTALLWKTTGTVAGVNVKVGDQVKAGDVLMKLDPLSAPGNVIQSQADLIAAQKALDDLLHPTALMIANAQKAAADAQKALEDAQRAQRNAAAPDVAYYADQYQRAQQTLTAAQQNAEITNFQTNLDAASDALTNATNTLNNIQTLDAQYPGYGGQFDRLKNAQTGYDRATENYQTALYSFQQAQARDSNTLTDAQKNLNTAQGNLKAAQTGASTTRQAQAAANVAVAQATLNEAQDKLNKLLNGADPKDLASATARVQAAQAVVDSLTIKAPFDGKILVTNYEPGDSVSATLPAVVLANQSRLHVDVSIDESDVGQIKVGDLVTITLDSLPDLSLPGAVSQINPVGSMVQGLVKYTVRVDMTQTDPRVLLGMTANANIITEVTEGALAVPLDAVQLDDQGEFVNRVKLGGGLERVNVVSGQIQDDLVTVTGDLKVGDKVQVVEPRPINNGSPFGRG